MDSEEGVSGRADKPVRDRRCICVFAFAFALPAALEATLAFADCVAAMLTVLPEALTELLRWLGGMVDILYL